MGGIHILRGRGRNCTCYDCAVLYGGKCYSTKDNDFLDTLEKKVLKYLNFTPTGKRRKPSASYMDSCIFLIVRPAVKRYEKITEKKFNLAYYGFMPLLYLMTTDRERGHWYKRARHMLFRQILERLEDQEDDDEE